MRTTLDAPSEGRSHEPCDSMLTARLGPLALLGLLILLLGACGEPDAAITPQASVSPDLESRAVGPDERVELASGLSAVLPDRKSVV